MGGRALFKKGQKCLVPHTDQYYLAHVLQAKKRDDGVYYYLLHYDGWSKKYDEWVEESGMLKFDESLLGQPTSDFATPAGDGTDPPATEAAAAAAAAGPGGGTGGAGGKAGGTAAAAGGGGGGGSVRKRKADGGGEAAAADAAMPNQLRLHMPPLLKKVILDDHDQVTHQYHVQPLPRRPCVRNILRAFEQAREAGGGAVDAATLEVLSGLLSYFDQGLRQLLLYHQEVQLHDEAVTGGKAPSEVYGGEHLVRLLVKLPELVPVATMGAQNVVTLEGRLHDLMAFLADKQGQFFLPSSAYVPNPHFEPPLPLPPLPAGPSPAAAAAALPPATPAAATVGGP